MGYQQMKWIPSGRWQRSLGWPQQSSFRLQLSPDLRQGLHSPSLAPGVGFKQSRVLQQSADVSHRAPCTQATPQVPALHPPPWAPQSWQAAPPTPQYASPPAT